MLITLVTDFQTWELRDPILRSYDIQYEYNDVFHNISNVVEEMS